jgi:hypothetical protein
VNLSYVRRAALCVTFAGVALGLAAPASADELNGTYSATPTSGAVATPWIVTLTPCGPGCTRLTNKGGRVTELHLEGNNWTGSQDAGTAYTFDKDSLAGTYYETFEGQRFDYAMVLTKAG